jgi:NAD(P)-dependent dehydrogenase (short-subunit alcohol dehydrogenase family)
MRAIVTGAASGIGLAVAKRLHSDTMMGDGRAAQLVLADRDEKYLLEACEVLRVAGAEVVPVVADLSEPQAASHVVATAAQAFDGVDALVSNAGIILHSSLLDLSLEEYERTFAINTRATWLLAKAAYPYLKAARGAIVATASMAAYEPTPALGAYAPSKAALVMLIRQLACDWGPDGIRCNTVSPGTTLTNITGRERATAMQQAKPVGRNPLGIISEPEDQAGVIAFLLKQDARFINGADIVVDGGARTQLMKMWVMARSGI